ncbi:nucleotide-binding universal stress UspA family protein [Streptomyces sp. SAI-135]|uniref:universal stress protein n=1 Tax=unclassified Streptomyces TaxID=2593676 RepID=UPI0024746806|nr:MULTISPECIES: universal stress protein [unclassified Streptomyces]MDH6514147.1 nucleotide-binding universal stress UspA family protein [Streptomyces sp. SAI-090]MDH6589661.1 nucleotide-binding universal stress UspA family protein [Streptomyces sp. SAI-133]MDH6621773.1 nucleotide-binding universal stress UspA family protein [Streptomyces sp. SAI-135]
MPGMIIVGLDGSIESRAAADWAAREASLRGLTVRLVHVWQPAPDPMAQAPLLGAETHQHWTERIPREAAQGLRLRHPGVEVSTEQRSGTPADVLLDAARDAELLVLGSRALSGIGGFLVGSVGQSVAARAEVPLVLVRAGEQAADEHLKDAAGIPSAATGFRPVVLGLDTSSPDDQVISFAFEEALRRTATLAVVHSWNLPSYYAYTVAGGYDPREDIARAQAGALTEVLLPWREKYPEVKVEEMSRTGSPASHLIDASHEASLVVVGRRVRRSPFGVHIGSVTHAVMHHATAPVAVVAHE